MTITSRECHNFCMKLCYGKERVSIIFPAASLEDLAAKGRRRDRAGRVPAGRALVAAATGRPALAAEALQTLFRMRNASFLGAARDDALGCPAPPAGAGGEKILFVSHEAGQWLFRRCGAPLLPPPSGTRSFDLLDLAAFPPLRRAPPALEPPAPMDWELLSAASVRSAHSSDLESLAGSESSWVLEDDWSLVGAPPRDEAPKKSFADLLRDAPADDGWHRAPLRHKGGARPRPRAPRFAELSVVQYSGRRRRKLKYAANAEVRRSARSLAEAEERFRCGNLSTEELQDRVDAVNSAVELFNLAQLRPLLSHR